MLTAYVILVHTTGILNMPVVGVVLAAGVQAHVVGRRVTSGDVRRGRQRRRRCRFNSVPVLVLSAVLVVAVHPSQCLKERGIDLKFSELYKHL